MGPQHTLPLIPLRHVVLFPHMLMPFIIRRPASTRALEGALSTGRRVFLAAQHDAEIEEPTSADVYTTGCMAEVVDSLKRTSAPTAERRVERTIERRLASLAVKDMLRFSYFPGGIPDRAVRIAARTSPASRGPVFAFRGLSITGTARLRELLERHELALDIADGALDVLLRLLAGEHDEAVRSLRSLSPVLREFRAEAHAAWTIFGIKGRR